MHADMEVCLGIPQEKKGPPPVFLFMKILDQRVLTFHDAAAHNRTFNGDLPRDG